MRLLLLAVSLLCFSIPLFAQQPLGGQVLDAETETPLPFATIRWGKSTGTVADKDGRFTVLSREDTLQLEFRYVGYQGQHVHLLQDTTNFLRVYLQKEEHALQEVTVYAGANPAHAIIRRAVENRDQNNPLRLNSYSYQTYNQFYMSLEPAAGDTVTTQPDSLTALQQLADSSYLFFNESYIRHHWQNGQERQTVVASQTAGTRHMIFTTAATDLQPFAFYEDYISLLQQEYLNPLSPNSIRRYDFELVDSLLTPGDTTFIIHYRPQANKNFKGLEGVLYISSDGYALRNVIARNADKDALMVVRIRQEYHRYPERWFPSMLEANLYFPENTEDGLLVMATVQTILRDVNLDPPDTLRFSRYSTRMEPDAVKKDSVFWQDARLTPLSLKAANTYKRLENSKEGRIFDGLAIITEGILSDRFPVGWLDVRWSSLVKYNQYEGIRPGIGISTNASFSKVLEVGAYAGWGLRDQALKYHTSVKLNIHEPTGLYVKGNYSQDLQEPGASDLVPTDLSFVLDNSRLRNWYLYRMDSLHGYSFALGLSPYVKGLELQLGLNKHMINPTYPYSYAENVHDLLASSYELTETYLKLNYRHRQKQAMWGGKEFTLGYELPVISLQLSRGMQVWEGQFAYIRLEAMAAGSRRWRGFGSSHWQFMGGWGQGELPYHCLFSLRGAATDDNFLDITATFRTMGVHEFAASSYVALWLQHKLGHIRTGSRWSRPEFVLAQHTAWGTLPEAEKHDGVKLSAPENIYSEAGLQLNDLLRLNYLNVSYLGVGISIYYRYGAYALPEAEDNLFYRFLLRYSFE